MNNPINEIKNSNRFGTKQKRIAEVKRLGWVLAGCFCYAFFMNVFIVPMGLYSGGFMGMSQIIRTVINNTFHINTGSFDYAGIINLGLNVILFSIAKKNLGKMYMFRTAYCILLTTVCLSIVPVPAKGIMDDMLASALIGGIGCGLGGGLILRNGCSGGGMDLVGAVLIQKYQNLSISIVSNAVNIVVFGLMFFMFGAQMVIYSLIYSLIYPMIVDRVFSQNINVEVHIITDCDDGQLQREIFEKLNRGVTNWDAVGAYTGEGKQILYVLVSKYQLNHLVWIVHKYDPHALIVENVGVRINGNFEKRLE